MQVDDACKVRAFQERLLARITYDPETLKRVWESLVVGAGADVLLHSFVHGVDLKPIARDHDAQMMGGNRRVVDPDVVVGRPSDRQRLLLLEVAPVDCGEI